MDSEAIRRKRLDDIESKRKRLEEMRKSRSSVATSNNSINMNTTVVDIEKNDAIIKIDTDTLVSTLLASNSVADNAEKTPENNDNNNDINKNPSLVSIQDVRIEKMKTLSTVKCGNILSILPTSQIMYDKSIQTDEKLSIEYNNNVHNQSFSSTINNELSSSHEQGSGVKSSSTLTQTAGIGSDIAITSDLNKELLYIKKSISEEECTKIMATSGFLSFLHTASLHTERALTISGQHMDILKDFSTDDSNKNSDDYISDSSFQVTNMKYQEDSVVGRPIMHIQYSPLVPDMFLAAYGSKAATANITTTSSMYSNNSTTSNSTEENILPGLVCVWTKDFPTRAEFKFMAPSPVLTAIFHTHESHLILGGCYNGQILLWDMRSATSSHTTVAGGGGGGGKQSTNRSFLRGLLPIQRSSSTGKGHKHPVYAMTMVNNNTVSSATGGLMGVLISVSNDGLLCQWDITRLMEPLTVIQLQSFGNISLLNISAMAVLSNNNSSGNSGEAPTDIIFGSSSGIIIHSTLPFKEGNPDTIKMDCHCGLITSIHPHPSRNSKYKHLLLTSSLDWTVKLWDLKRANNPFNKPLMEFPSSHYDYVCDVQWSPINPAVFITITSGGKITLWNLSKSVVEPVDSIIINTNSTTITISGGNQTKNDSSIQTTTVNPNPNPSKVALNRTLWARDGQSFLIGDSHGTLYLIKLLTSSSSQQLSSNDETRFELAMLNRNDYTTSGDGIESESKYESTATIADDVLVGGGSQLLDDENASSLKDEFDAISITNI